MDKNIQKAKITIFDKLVYVTAFAYPFTALPQILKIYTTRSADDLSLATWVLYSFFEVVLTIYGFKNKLRPLVIQGVLWLFVYSIIIAGILLYG